MFAAWFFSITGICLLGAGIESARVIYKYRKKTVVIEPEDTVEADFAAIYKNDLAEWDRRFAEQTGKIVRQLLDPQEYEREQLMAMKNERVFLAQMSGLNMSQQGMNNYLGQLGGMATGNAELGNAIGGALGGLLGNGRLQ